MNHQFGAIVDVVPNSDQEMLDIAHALSSAGCLDSSVGDQSEGVELSFNRNTQA